MTRNIPGNIHRRLPVRRELQNNLDNFETLLARKEFEVIIKDKKLFWLAYCQAVALLNKPQRNDFSVSIEGKNIKISGIDSVLQNMEYQLEQLRQVFLEGLEKRKESEILVIQVGCFFYFRKESPVVDLSHATTSEGCDQFYYYGFIEAALHKLAEFCGAVYTVDKKNQNINTDHPFSPVIQEVSVTRISWQDKFHLTYPIAPNPIPEMQEMNKELYRLYQEQLFFGDGFELNFKGGATKVHACVLYLHGGQTIQGLLNPLMNEMEDKKISFTNYSQNTVLSFIDFIYIGGNELIQNKISLYNKIPISEVFELFEFANFLQNKPLIDCSTNFISLYITRDNVEAIKLLVEVYKNEHLQRLYDHFSRIKKTNHIKV